MRSVEFLIAAIAVGFGSWFLPEFYVTVLNYVGLYAIVALGIVLLTGVVGITSFGQAAFVGLSAYLSAILTTRFGLPPVISLVACIAVTVTVAALIGFLTLNLSGHYLPLGTIAWGLSAYYALGNIELLGGHTGLDGIPPVSIGGIALESGRQMFVLIWLITLGSILLISNMLDSRSGRAMRAIKTSRETAESFGVDTRRMRLVAFLYAAALASLSGWLYAHMLRFLNPSPFSLVMGIEYLFMAVVGGAGHVWGALLGAGVITILKEYLQDALPRLFGQAGNFEIICFGVMVIALLQLNGEDGISSLFGRVPMPRRRRRVAPARGGLASRDRTQAADQTAPVLRVEGVSKAFGGLQALSDVRFSVDRGEIVAVIGPNGAGKSTLFNAITGLVEADRGAVWINGHRADLRRTRNIVSHGVARTFQHVQLVERMSVLENVMLGAHVRAKRGSFSAALGIGQNEEAQLRAEATRHLERVGLADLSEIPATNLALGQQRLVEVARALCADPEILLLDEPAAGLRYSEKRELAALLRDLRNSGLAVLLVEHDMDFVMNLSDRIVVMNFGQKLLEGEPEAVRTNARVIEAYLGRQAA
jgi:branched-chain amino acid transport system permease protein